MNETENKSTFWSQFFIWAAVIGLCAFVAALDIPNFIRARATSSSNPCINNLRHFDAAINEWALENKKTNGTPVTWNDIKPYFKLDANGNIPSCYLGGKYTLRKVGDDPQVTCSLSTLTPGHFLP
jgi:hypothetical protein